MEPIHTIAGTAVALMAENVDTDRIIPARYLTTVSREGLGEGLFADWRCDAQGLPLPDFPLNRPQCMEASILIAGPNFGCGSSREHAPWALLDAGFKAVISPNFADIFYNNSLKNGLLPVVLPEPDVQRLADLADELPNAPFQIDLAGQKVYPPVGEPLPFPLDSFRKLCLLQGIDDLGYLLSKEPAIAAFERVRG